MDGKQIVKLAPLNVAPQHQALIDLELTRLNTQTSRPYEYQFAENTKGAEILIAEVEVEDLHKTNQLMQRVYGIKSTIFLRHQVDTEAENYRYQLEVEQLDSELIGILDEASNALYGLQKSQPVSKKPSKETNTQQATASNKYFGKVLIVDDSELVRNQLEMFMSKRRFKCLLAENAAQALQIASKEHCDLVFMDIVMPGSDGYQACKALKSLKTAAAIPVILLTSKNSPTDKIRGIMSGCDRYLTKPVRGAEIDELLKAYFPNFGKALLNRTQTNSISRSEQKC